MFDKLVYDNTQSPAVIFVKTYLHFKWEKSNLEIQVKTYVHIFLNWTHSVLICHFLIVGALFKRAPKFQLAKYGFLAKDGFLPNERFCYLWILFCLLKSFEGWGNKR